MGLILSQMERENMKINAEVDKDRKNTVLAIKRNKLWVWNCFGNYCFSVLGFCLDLLPCPFPFLFATFWSWKLPLYFATSCSSNLSFSLVFATSWYSNCSCRMVFRSQDSFRVGFRVGLVFVILGRF